MKTNLTLSRRFMATPVSLFNVVRDLKLIDRRAARSRQKKAQCCQEAGAQKVQG